MLTPNDISALRRFQRGSRAPTRRARGATVCGGVALVDPFGVGARTCAFWRDGAETAARLRARWTTVWIDSAVAALALHGYALFPHGFGRRPLS